MSFSDFLENELLDHAFGPGAYTAPATLYVALSTTTPTDAGANFTEPTAMAYARVAVTNNATQWPAASGGSKTNANAITFTTATGNWTTITHFAIYDDPTAGNMLVWGALSAPKAVNNGDTFRFNASALTITLD